MHRSSAPMSVPVDNILGRVHSSRVENRVARGEPVVASKGSVSVRTLLAMPVAAIVAGGIHAWAEQKQPLPERQYYYLLGAFFVIGVMASIFQGLSSRVRKWVVETGPIMAAGIFLLSLWE